MQQLEACEVNGGASSLAGARAGRPKNLQCQADGCSSCLLHEKAYFQRHRVCATHLRALDVTVCGESCRFCQQCARFHPTTEFDGTKRSCRTRLSQHNARRRCKPEAEAAAAAAGEDTYEDAEDDKTNQSDGSILDPRKFGMCPEHEGSTDMVSTKGRSTSARRPVRAAALACNANMASVAAALAMPVHSKDSGGSPTAPDQTRRKKPASSSQLPVSSPSQGSCTHMGSLLQHRLGATDAMLTDQGSWDHLSDMMGSCGTPTPPPPAGHTLSPQSRPSQQLPPNFFRSLSNLSGSGAAATPVIHNVAMAAGWGTDIVDYEMRGLISRLQGSRKRPAQIAPNSNPNMPSGWSAAGLLNPSNAAPDTNKPDPLWTTTADVLMSANAGSHMGTYTVGPKPNSMPTLPSWNTSAPPPNNGPIWSVAPRPVAPPAVQACQANQHLAVTSMWSITPDQQQQTSAAMVTDTTDWLSLSDDLGLPKIPDDTPDTLTGSIKIEPQVMDMAMRGEEDMSHTRPLARQRSDAFVLEVGLMDKLCVANSPAKAVPTKFSYAPVYQSVVVPQQPAPAPPAPAPAPVSVFQTQPQAADVMWVPVERQASMSTAMAAEPLWLLSGNKGMDTAEDLPPAPPTTTAFSLNSSETSTVAPPESRIQPHEVPQMLSAISMKVANCVPENLPGELYKRLHLLVTTTEASKLRAMLQQSDLLLALV